MVFYSNDVGGGSSRANKTSYSPTIIAGSSTLGDPLPVHFQLKIIAQTESGQKLIVDFFKYTKDFYGKFGHKEQRFSMHLGHEWKYRYEWSQIGELFH